MLKKSVIVFLLCFVSIVCLAEVFVSGKNTQACKVTLQQDAACSVKVKGMKEQIGYVEYNKKLRKYVSVAYFPSGVPYAFRRTVREFLTEVTGKSSLPGKYFIDMSNGVCGYYELSDTAVWQPRDIYKLWPEIFRIVSINARVSTVLKTVEMFPLSERTQGDLTKMKAFKVRDFNPGEFDYDMFSVEQELMPSAPEKVPSFTIDKKKIKADFEKLLADKKFLYHVELKNAAVKRDMETVCRIAARKDVAEKEGNVCRLYAAVNGHAKINFKLAKDYFMIWRPEKMMPFLRKAVELKLPEAEHFLGQYLYRFDLGTPEEIFHLWKRAYKGGYIDAEASLARCYWFGFGTKRNQKKAFVMAKKYLSKIKKLSEDDCFHSIAKTVAGLGYLKFDKNKEKGLKLINDPVTEQGVMVANSVYWYGLYGVPQSYGEHCLGGGLQPHWAHLDVLFAGYRSNRDKKMLRILEYQ